MKFKIALIAGACVLGLAAAPASAATLIVSNGVLTGATGVIVNGTSYDVAFAKGTCAQAFGSCDQSKFAFSTLQDATSAAQALFSQVLIDGPQGKFDSDPQKVFNCAQGSFGCITEVAYAENANSYTSVVARNAGVNSIAGSFVLSKGFDYTTSGDRNYAIFALSPVAPAAGGAVPEPATWAMMMFGFGGMGYALRRKQNAGTRIRFA